METRILTSWVVVRIKLNVKMPGTGPNSSRHSLELLDKYLRTWVREGHAGVTVKANSPTPKPFLGLLAAYYTPHPLQTDALRQSPGQEHPVWNTQFTLPSGEWKPEEEEPGVPAG